MVILIPYQPLFIKVTVNRTKGQIGHVAEEARPEEYTCWNNFTFF